MSKVNIPTGAWMRMRSKGRYVYAKNEKPIIWQNVEPKGVPIYCVTWSKDQNRFMACRIIKSAA